LNELVAHINNLLGKENLPRDFDGIATQNNSEVKPIYTEARQGDIKHSFANIDLIKSRLDYKSNVEFNEGLQLTIESFMS